MEPIQVYSIRAEEVIEQFESDRLKGLSSDVARLRLEKYGYNELAEKPRASFLKLVMSQFEGFLVRMLIAAAAISIMLGEVIDASAIIMIVILNAVMGVVQESKAEKALAALKKMSSPNARVIRDGIEEMVSSRELVPGDIVLVEAGNYIPADIRLIESMNLKVDEASLTGESVSVNKDPLAILDSSASIGDRKNSAFMGTLVTYGRGKGIVSSTGMGTQLGLIAEMIQSSEEEQTPLQNKLEQLGKTLGGVCLLICGLVFIYGIIRDTNPGIILSQGFIQYLSLEKKDIIELFMTAVSLAIAAVPEGLPAVVTICLALGMQKMVKRGALIRKLPAVETLGCATVICSDKTGTLTQNEMTVTCGWSGGTDFSVTGEGYGTKGTFSRNGSSFDARTVPEINLMLLSALLCNDARLEPGESESECRIVGDPTEAALVVMAAKAGYDYCTEDGCLPRISEVPFDSERKCMTTIHSLPSNSAFAAYGDSPYIAFVKGAPDIILNHCDSVMINGKIVPLTEVIREQILSANSVMARRALRGLGIAFRFLTSVPHEPKPEDVEVNLIFLGNVGMIDPARPEVRAAVQVAKTAGIKSVMVTGDYKDTATAIAKEIGMLSPNGRVITGAELEVMSEESLSEIVEDVDAYARVSPAHKMKIIDAFKRRGHVVAMTGDGVNDAPALKRANIGVAMGITGTDVSKESADMVLTDDNYASIVSAIEEGRVIYSNIRKFVFYLITCNIGEILIVFVSMIAGLPIPFKPIQLLWLNLVTDGAPALALGLEKGDPDIMKRSPRPSKEHVINAAMIPGVVLIPLADTVAVLGAFYLALQAFGSDNLRAAQTVSFATLVCSELLRAYTARSERHSVFKIGFFSNKSLVFATLISFVLLMGVIYIPVLQPFFGTVALGLNDWLRMSPFIFVAPVVSELIKFIPEIKKSDT